MLKILNSRFFRGPNLHFSSSGILLTINYGNGVPEGIDRILDREEVPTILKLLREVFPVATETSLLVSPELVCQSQEPAMALFLTIAEIPICDFCSQPAPGFLVGTQQTQFYLFLPCDDETIGLAACGLSLDIINAIPTIKEGNQRQLRDYFKDRYRKVRSHNMRRGLDQSTMAMVKAARQQDIPYSRLTTSRRIVQLGQGVYRKRIMETMTDDTSGIGMIMQRDKFTTSQILMRHNLPSAGTQIVSSTEQALKIAQKIGFPLVVKPRSAGKGKGVTVNITSQAGLDSALRIAARYKSGVIIERYIRGDDHRLLVVGGRLVSAAKRLPASVVGDGQNSVAELVEILNLDPRRGMAFEKLLEEIEMDQEALDHLERVGLTPESIPTAGQEVALRGTANISRGGTSVDVTDDVHPDNRLMVERATRLVGLDVAGIDFHTPDICQSWRDIPCAILEVNATPGLRPHLGANPQRDVAGAIIRQMFPHGSDGRIPTVGVTGSLGKTTTCQMITAILSESGKKVALSTTQGAWIGEERIRIGDVAGGRTAQMLLQDPSVEAGVFELARGGLIKAGMALDGVDIGVMLNVHDNHLGLSGINKREEMALVKRLVVQNARKLAILNADDPLCLATQEYITAPQLCLVSTVADNLAVLSHQRKGGLIAYVATGGSQPELSLWKGSRCIGRMPGHDILDSWGGRFRPALTNALFAMAAAHGLGIRFDTITAALSKFHSLFDTNPGRNNFYQGLPYSLLVSHADGPQAIQEVAYFVDQLEISGNKRLLVCSAGNRPDEFIRGMARSIAGRFSSYICTNYHDLRGRQPDEVPQLLARELKASGVPREQIQVVPSPKEAVKLAYDSLKADDLLVDNTYNNDCGSKWLQQRGLAWLKSS